MTLQASFDQQAKTFESRVGIDDTDCKKISFFLAQYFERTNQKVWLEIGAGTGQIGCWSLDHAKRYVGMDISGEMLKEFRGKITGRHNVQLHQADANQSWPLESQSVSLSFSSRTIHLLSPHHVMSELQRVHDGGYFLIGRLGREESTNVKDVMRGKMREILHSLGHESRRGEENRKQILDLLCERGATRVNPVAVASWFETYSPLRSIESWLSKDGLAGRAIDHSIKKECMKRLRDWAQDRYGSIEYSESVKQSYIIEGVDMNSLH